MSKNKNRHHKPNPTAAVQHGTPAPTPPDNAAPSSGAAQGGTQPAQSNATPAKATKTYTVAELTERFMLIPVEEWPAMQEMIRENARMKSDLKELGNIHAEVKQGLESTGLFGGDEAALMDKMKGLIGKLAGNFLKPWGKKGGDLLDEVEELKPLKKLGSLLLRADHVLAKHGTPEAETVQDAPQAIEAPKTQAPE